TTKIPDQIERGKRGLPRSSDGLECAGDGDVIDVVAGRRGQGTRLPPTGHPTIDEPRIALHAHVRSHAQALGNTGTKAFYEPVGLVDQAQHQISPVSVLQAYGDRPSSAVHQIDVRMLLRGGGGAIVAVDANDVGTPF